jgi:DNA-binding MarR family transcriptional regulator
MMTGSLNSICDDLLATLPLILRIFRKKISKLPVVFREDISPLHFETMKTLEKEGTLRISEVASRLMIPRPQMTHLIDRLVDLNLVERQMEAADRRTINVTITDKARTMLKEMDSVVKSNIRDALSSLTDEEMQELLASVKKLREIFSKLE